MNNTIKCKKCRITFDYPDQAIHHIKKHPNHTKITIKRKKQCKKKQNKQ